MHEQTSSEKELIQTTQERLTQYQEHYPSAEVVAARKILTLNLKNNAKVTASHEYNRQYIQLVSTAIDNQSYAQRNTVMPTGIVDFPITQLMQQRLLLVPGGELNFGDQSIIINELTIDRFAMTQKIYSDVMEKNPSIFSGNNRPVDNVSWYDAIKFCNALSLKTGRSCYYEISADSPPQITSNIAANGYRLPSENEWQFALGTKADISTDLQKIAWFSDNANNQTQLVGQLAPNKNGLYDMLGNVWEWCFDVYQEGYPYPANSDLDKENEEGNKQEKRHVIRGGSWLNFNSLVHCESRDSENPSMHDYNQGFRVLLHQPIITV